MYYNSVVSTLIQRQGRELNVTKTFPGQESTVQLSYNNETKQLTLIQQSTSKRRCFNIACSLGHYISRVTNLEILA